jgi:hypothetical protein
MAEDVPECKEVGGLVILMMKIIGRPNGRLLIWECTVINAKYPKQNIPSQVCTLSRRRSKQPAMYATAHTTQINERTLVRACIHY